MAWLIPFCRAVAEADSRVMENWPAAGLLLVVGGAVFGGFRTGFVRFGSDVKELLAEKEARVRERDARIEELKAELAATRKALEEAQAVARLVNATNAKATRTLEAVAAAMTRKQPPGPHGTPQDVGGGRGE